MDTIVTPSGNNFFPSGKFRKRASILSVCVLTSAGVFLSPGIANAAEIAVPIPPTAIDNCGTANDLISIEAAGGVTWYQIVNGARVEVSPGLIPAGGLTADVVATPTDPADTFPGGETEINYNLTYTDNICVTATAPTFADESGTVNDTVTIPVTEGIDYLLNGTTVTAGVYPAEGAVVVEAVAQPGYQLNTDTQSIFNFNFNAAAIIAPVTPSVQDNCGITQDGIIIEAQEGVTYRAITADGTQDLVVGLNEGFTGDVQVEAVAQPGYEFAADAQVTWSFTLTDVACPIATPADPTFVDLSGTANDTVTIPEVEGVDYVLNGNVVAAGEYPGVGNVTVEAVAETGYTLDPNADNAWNFAFDADVIVNPQSPEFNDVAGTANDTVTIPAVEGVDYFVDGTLTAAGTYPGLGTVDVEARVQAGYEFAAGATTAWAYTFTNVGEVVIVTPAIPVVDGNTVIIPDAVGIQYFIDGEPVEPGRYPITGETVITAEPLEGYQFAAGAETEWVVEPEAVTPPVTTPVVPIVTPVPVTAPVIDTFVPAPGVLSPASNDFVVDDFAVEDERLAETGANPGLLSLIGAGGLLTALGAAFAGFGRKKKA